MYLGACVCCGHLHFFKEKRDGWIWTFLLYPPSLTFLQAVNIRVSVNLPPFCPEVQFSSGWVPPPRLSCRDDTWGLLQHCLPWSRAYGLHGSTGLPLLLPWSLANHLSFTFTQNPLSFWTLPSVHTTIWPCSGCHTIGVVCWGIWICLPSHAMISSDFTFYVVDKFNILVSKLPDLPTSQLPTWLPIGPNQHHLWNL